MRFASTCVCLFVLSACGGSAKPAASPGATGSDATAAPKEEGVHAFVKTTPGGSDFSFDLAGMRADKNLSTILTKADASADPKMVAFMKQVDALDATSVGGGEEESAIAVMWGHFPSDPSGVPLLGPAKSFTPAPPLASGVKEFSSTKKECLFVLSDTVWVLANGSMCATAREKLAASADAPKMPSDRPLVYASFGSGTLKATGAKEVESLEHVQVELKSGMTSLKGHLAFKDEAGAKEAEDKVRALVPILGMLGGGKCKAIALLSVDVARDAANLNVELKGLGAAADAWDPATCPNVGGGSSASAAADPPGGFPAASKVPEPAGKKHPTDPKKHRPKKM